MPKKKLKAITAHAITKEYIFERVRQEDIFQRYLGVHVDTRDTIRSPLRRDENPTCSFKWINGKLRFRDWAVGETWDCFDIVRIKYGLNYNNTLKKIAEDFGLIGKSSKPKKITEFSKEQILSQRDIVEKPLIQIKKQEFTREDVEFLKSFHITRKQTEKFNVFSPKFIWLNKRLIYRYDKKDPALAYYFGTDSYKRQKWKIYFYKRKGRKRFLCNTNRINGIIQIPKEASILIMTKSLKDVMVLDRLDIPAIAMQNETMLPYDYIIAHLKKRFKKIYTLYDFDPTGIRTANKIKRIYQIEPLFLFNGRFGSIDYQAKDISDFTKAFGLIDTARLVIHCFTILTLKEYYGQR